MDVRLGTASFKDGTLVAMLSQNGSASKFLWFTVEIDGTPITILTKTGKDSLDSIHARPIIVDLEIPLDITMAEYTDELAAISDHCKLSDLILTEVNKDAPATFFITCCREVIKAMTLGELGEQADVACTIEEIMAKCKATRNGMKLFGMQPVRMTPIDNLTWVSKVSDDVREVLVTKLADRPIESIARDLMCNEHVAQAILDGTVEMSVGKFLVLCKLVGVEPSDLFNVVCNNNATYIKV